MQRQLSDRDNVIVHRRRNKRRYHVPICQKANCKYKGKRKYMGFCGYHNPLRQSRVRPSSRHVANDVLMGDFLDSPDRVPFNPTSLVPDPPPPNVDREIIDLVDIMEQEEKNVYDFVNVDREIIDLVDIMEQEEKYVYDFLNVDREIIDLVDIMDQEEKDVYQFRKSDHISLVVGECSICMDEMFDTDAVNLRCGHLFHKKCINYWKKGCPLCRGPINVVTSY